MSPCAPRTKINIEQPLPALASSVAPDAPELIRRLRNVIGTPLTEQLVGSGAVDLGDLKLHRINRRLAGTAEAMRENYENFLNTADEVFQEYSTRFLRQAKSLTWEGIIPLSPSTIDERFRQLTIRVSDPTKSGDTNPSFDDTSQTLLLPVPVIGGSLSYEDFVHEALHGISGRQVATVTQFKKGRPWNTTTETIRSGVRFKVPNLKQDCDRFEWLNEGITQHLVSLFIPEEEQDMPAYVDEVDIIRVLIAPQGLYRIPLKALTAAYFADFDPTAPPSLRYAEWHDLNSVLPVRELLKISRLIDDRGIEDTLGIVASRNIFEVSEAELLWCCL